ncbi:MAG: translational GTPase TypA [Phycisphaeraceae bacterium]
MTTALLRNVAIIAHVDHGKTTLVDQLLYQSGMFRDGVLDKLAGGQHNLIMDTGDLERERGITITAKNCSVQYHAADSNNYRINLIDTPGHADFGGEVERVLSMADGVLLLVDAFEGPMPQTRFVLEKALALDLKPVVVVNKIDRPDARPDDVVNEVFDLLVELEASDDALDFPIVYSSAKDGWATTDPKRLGDDHPTDIRALYEAIIEHVPGPQVRIDADANKALRMLVSTLGYSEYVGRIAIGRVTAGFITTGQNVTVIDRAGKQRTQKVNRLLQFNGLSREPVERVDAGDLCAVEGLDPIDIGDTIACAVNPAPLPSVKVDEPTVTMTFRVNDSPTAGREGTFVTSRQVWDRLQRELQSNVALHVERGSSASVGSAVRTTNTQSSSETEFRVSGRGLMHLGVLIETMRREGYELTVGKPEVILKRVDNKLHEPIEQLVVDCPVDCQNDVMSLVTMRRAEIARIDPKAGAGSYMHMVFTIPARGLIGLRTQMLTATQGRAVMHHNLLRYEPIRGDQPGRSLGVLIATDAGQVTAYSLDRLFDRGVFFVRPGDQVYAGQIVGQHCRENDISVNLVINKKLTNVRSSGTDDQTRVRPAREMSLEACLEFIEDDELVEVTPKSIRLRKRQLAEADRRRAARRTASV